MRQPAAFLPEQVLCRHEGVVEEQLGGVLCAAADLFELGPACEALLAVFDAEQRQPAAPVVVVLFEVGDDDGDPGL